MHQHVLSTPSIGSNELGGFGRFWTPNGPVVFPLSKWDFKDGISPSWWLSFAPHRVKSTWFMAHHGLESAGCQGLIIDKINHGHWTSNIIWLSSRDTTINALRRLVVSGLSRLLAPNVSFLRTIFNRFQLTSLIHVYKSIIHVYKSVYDFIWFSMKPLLTRFVVTFNVNEKAAWTNGLIALGLNPRPILFSYLIAF